MADKTLSDRGLNGDWAAYYEETGRRQPRQTLIRALDAFDREGRPDRALAADLGCGSGRDTIEILRRGWLVHAVDASPDAIEGLLTRDDLPADASIEIQLTRYEHMMLPPCDLINAAFSLPLCPPSAFPRVWQTVRDALKVGGRFSGQLYGNRDSWAGHDGITFHTREQLDSLLSGLKIEFLEEEEEDSVTPRGTPKHWHIFHIVTKRQ